MNPGVVLRARGHLEQSCAELDAVLRGLSERAVFARESRSGIE